MHEAYEKAYEEIYLALKDGGDCLDCGSSYGKKHDVLKSKLNFLSEQYYGIEWNKDSVNQAQKKGLNIIQGDLNRKMEYPDEKFRCIFGLSVLEHLLFPCRYLNECYRCLEKDGYLVILTPNISTYFTIALLLAGKMPSSGPHPDSNSLLKQEEIFKVSSDTLQHDTESDTPVHRHLIVFSYKVLKSYLKTIGFKDVQAYGFGLYPFPNFMQGILERIDPYHCHQMVFIAKK